MNWKSFKDNPPDRSRLIPAFVDKQLQHCWGDYIFDIKVNTDNNSHYRLTVPASYSNKQGWYIPGTFSPENRENKTLDHALGDNIEILYWDYFPYPNYKETVTREANL